MSDDAPNPPARAALLTRLAIGLAQGVGLYLLSRSDTQLLGPVRGALALGLLFTPVVALGTLWAVRPRTAAIWITAAAGLAAALGAYSGYARPQSYAAEWVAPETGVFVAAALFILHHLVVPADVERRWRAGYDRYFDEGWKDAVQLGLAVLFVGVLWALLGLGTMLFSQIGLDFLKRLTRQAWFAMPVTTTCFALAIHLTDLRVNLVRGARTLLLTLLSWLLPLLTVIAVGFLVALLFTGLKPLLSSQSTTGTMLAACAALVILINATYQDGAREDFPPFALKWGARIAALALVPLTLVATYGLALRIGQHGLTVDRIHALACLVVGGCYAAGYAWAALSRGRWMARLELTNWLTAHVAVAMLIAIFSPVLDPARLATGSQVHRLTSGAVSPARFDFDYLRFEAGPWGLKALRRLADDKASPEIAAAARTALARKARWEPPVLSPAQRSATFEVVGGPLPPSFLAQAWKPQEDPARECQRSTNATADCRAMVLDVDDAPGSEVVVVGRSGTEVYGLDGAGWRLVGRLEPRDCKGDLKLSTVTPGKRLPPTLRSDIEIGGRRLGFVPRTDCPTAPTGSQAVTDVAIVRPAAPSR